MKVGELIKLLENFDKEMPVRIGVEQRHNDTLAMGIEWHIEERKIQSIHDLIDYNAVVIIQDTQEGIVVED
jgi:hypothetical protein